MWQHIICVSSVCFLWMSRQLWSSFALSTQLGSDSNLYTHSSPLIRDNLVSVGVLLAFLRIADLTEQLQYALVFRSQNLPATARLRQVRRFSTFFQPLNLELSTLHCRYPFSRFHSHVRASFLRIHDASQRRNCTWWQAAESVKFHIHFASKVLFFLLWVAFLVFFVSFLVWFTLAQTVTAVNLSLIRLDQHGRRSTLSSLQYKKLGLP